MISCFFVRNYSMCWCGAISPEVTTLLKHFIAFGLIWTTCISLFCTDWMVCPNKSVKRPFTVDLHLQLLLHDAMEAKFLDLNKPWSCKYGKQKKWTRMTGFLWLAWLHSETKRCPILFFHRLMMQMAFSVKKDKIQTFCYHGKRKSHISSLLK